MANVNAKIGLNYNAQSGDQTTQELLVAINAALPAVNPGVANKITDPVTGKLIRVELTMPESAAAIASAVITANRGVSTAVIAAPQLVLDDLYDVQGIVCPVVAKAYIDVNDFPGGTTFGRLYLETQAYTDGQELLSAVPCYMEIGANYVGSLGVTIAPADQLTLRISPTLSLDTVRTGSIVVDPQRFAQFYVAQDGKMYWKWGPYNGIPVNRTYEEAVGFPPV